MVRKVEKTTIELFDNCPFCGREFKIKDEGEKRVCWFCQSALKALEEYDKNKHILGAYIVDFDSKDILEFHSITIQMADGKRYLIEPEQYTGEYGIEINEECE